MVYLEVNDDASQKFWKIEKDASKKLIVTSWGKIGGKERNKEEKYSDEANAHAIIDKQVKQKMLKGYKLVAKGPVKMNTIRKKTSKASNINSKTKTPINAIIFTSIITLIICSLIDVEFNISPDPLQ